MNQFEQVRIASGLIEASIRERLKAAETLEDKFKIAFEEASDFWMNSDDNVRFKGGIGAVMIHVGTDSPEYDRITTELEQIKTLEAALSGVPVDWEQTPQLPDDFKAIGIIKLWKEFNQ